MSTRDLILPDNVRFINNRLAEKYRLMFVGSSYLVGYNNRYPWFHPDITDQLDTLLNKKNNKRPYALIKNDGRFIYHPRADAVIAFYDMSYTYGEWDLCYWLWLENPTETNKTMIKLLMPVDTTLRHDSWKKYCVLLHAHTRINSRASLTQAR